MTQAGALATFERWGATLAHSAESIRRPLLESDSLFYLHVPKSAGTTFIGIIDQWFVQDEIFPVHYDLRSFREDYTDEQLQEYRFIRGHFPYPLLMRRLKEKPRCFTFLRDPVTRFLSNFEMRQRLPDPLVGLQDRLKGMSLEAFMDAPDLMDTFANRATKYFGGVDRSPSGDRTPRLDAALERLEEKFDFVGLVERFADSVDLFAYVYALPPIQHFETLNVTPNRTAREATPGHLLDRARELNSLDVELYEAGVRRFEADLAAMNDELADGSAEVTIVGYPERVEFDLTRMPPGRGWHVAERHPDLGLIRWTGPERESTLRFAVADSSDLEVKISIASTSSAAALDEATISINGEELATTVEHAGPISLAAGIPRTLVHDTDGWTTLTLSAGEISEVAGRRLGVCVNGITVGPAGHG